MQKSRNGITLIALIITIIVLLILVGVSLNAVIGDNGLIERMQEAKIRTEDAQFKELAESIIFDAAEQREQGMTDEDLLVYLKNKFSELGERVIITQNGEEFLILCDNRVVTSEVRRNKGVEIDKDNVGISEEWAYKMDETDGKIIILACTITSGDISIPKFLLLQNETTGEYDEITFVKQLGDEGYNVFSYRSRITSVTIPEGIEKIGDNVFYECIGINQEIKFPSTLKEIGANAFYNCSGLTGNIIEKLDNSNVTKVGSNAFFGCSGLTGELKLFDNISLGSMVFASCPKITGDINILLTEGLTEIPDGAFSGMSGLTGTPNIPATVTRIGSYAFYNCSELTGILTVPSKCVSINDYAFYGCSGYTSLSIDISDNGKLEKIGNYSFSDCKGLKNNGLKFPKTLNEIGEGCFSGCMLLNEILDLSNLAISTIPKYSFNSTGFTNVLIPTTLEFIGERAFYKTNLTGEINLCNVTNLGREVFFGSSFIETIKFNQISYIDYGVFRNCINLKKLNFLIH